MLFSCKFVNGKDQKLKNKDGTLASIITTKQSLNGATQYNLKLHNCNIYYIPFNGEYPLTCGILLMYIRLYCGMLTFINRCNRIA